MSAAAEHTRLDFEALLPQVEELTRLHEWIAVVEPSGSVLWMSEGLSQVCGSDAALGLPWLDALAIPEHRGHLERQLRSRGWFAKARMELRLEGGRHLPVTVSAGPVAPGCPKLVAVIGRRSPPCAEFEETLLSMAAVLDPSPEPVVAVDRSGFITYVNGAMQELFGWSREELLGQPLSLLLRPGLDLRSALEGVGPLDEMRSVEFGARRKDGGSLDVAVSAHPLQLRDGRTVGAVAHLQDVTERRRFERALARKNDELEHYVHAVSHDLRSPLVSVLGFSRLLREDFAESLGEKGTHFVGRIEEAGRTMEALIHDLLELSRIDGTSARPDPVDSHKVLAQLQAEFKPRLDEAGIELVLPSDPPPVHCERTRLYQIFANLIGNALDHMGAVPSPRIEVQVEDEGAETRIRVSDNGRGIDPANHERIFEIFQSLSARPTSGKGGRTGMGLAIVKKIAESRGGRVSVESAPGRGAVFQVAIPHT